MEKTSIKQKTLMAQKQINGTSMRNLSLEKFFKKITRKTENLSLGLSKGICYGCPYSLHPSKFITEARLPSVMELGGGGLWAVMRFGWSHETGTTLMGLVPLWEGGSRARSLSGPHEDTARWLPENQGKSRIRQRPDLGLPSASRTVRNSYCLGPPVCSGLEQPEATQAEPKQERICYLSVSTQESRVYWRCSSFPGTGSTCGR